MIAVNLLPESVCVARLRRKRLRSWSLAILASALLAAGPVGWNMVRASRAAGLERQVRPLRGEIDAVRAKLTALTARQQQLHVDIERADALRRKRSWANLLTALAAQMPDEVWLTALESTNPVREASTVKVVPTAPAGEASTGKPQARVRLAGPTGLRLAGFALDHETMYAVIGMLKRLEIFETVELTQADKQPVGEGEAVAFVLVCTWTKVDG
jgi:Tfp pilus assembly protein PilN